jgi:hypothetical protein
VSRAQTAAIGFRVKSGWATAVLLSGDPDAPCAVDRSIVELSDETVPQSRQPYHAATGKEETDPAKIRKRIAVVRRAANRSVRELVERHRSLVPGVRGATLIVGSVIDPESIANPHIRAHAYEGQLFRTVVADALDECGVASQVVTEREAYAKGAALLGRSEAAIRTTLDAMRAEMGRPWGADEKLAALAAWMTLA